MWIWIGAFPGTAHGRNVLSPLRGRYRAGLALRHRSPVDRELRRTNQRRRQPLDVWLRNPHLCGTPMGGASAASAWMRPRPHPTRKVHDWGGGLSGVRYLKRTSPNDQAIWRTLIGRTSPISQAIWRTLTRRTSPSDRAIWHALIRRMSPSDRAIWRTLVRRTSPNDRAIWHALVRRTSP